MARFFFDIVRGHAVVRDAEGSELPDTDTVSAIAQDVLAEMMGGRTRVEENGVSVIVREETGRSIYRVTLTIVGEWLS